MSNFVNQVLSTVPSCVVVALLSFLASTSFSNAFMISKPLISSTSMNVVSFTTSTIHREEMDLKSMTMGGQLQQMYGELETKNEFGTEDSTQTHPNCDSLWKDERDVAMMTSELAVSSRMVDRDLVHSMLQQPWTYPLDDIKTTIQSMEALNCQCTEEGNHTNVAYDVPLNDKRDTAIATFTLYLNSVQNFVADAAATAKSEEEKAKNRKIQQQQEEEEETRKRKKRVEPQERSRYAHVDVAFEMSAIQNCVQSPGSKSMEVLKTMLTHLEAQINACNEDGTQTANAECDLDRKAQRDALLEFLVSQIHDAKICWNHESKAFADTDNNSNHMAMDDVMNTKMNTMQTIPNLATVPSSSSSSLKNTKKRIKKKTTHVTVATKKKKATVLPSSLMASDVSATPTHQRRSSPFTPFTALTDEFLIQI